MKILSAFFVFIIGIQSLLYSQAYYPDQIQREHVLMEAFFGTECCNLYGAELGIKTIIKNGDPVLIVRHDWCINSDGYFENEAATYRHDSCYGGGITDPWAFFNGTVEVSGGGDNSKYYDYLAAFTPLINDWTSFDLSLEIVKNDTNNYIAKVGVYKLGSFTTDCHTLNLALTIDTIKNFWSNYHSEYTYHCIQVQMLPDHYGTPANFSTSDTMYFEFPFSFEEVSYRKSHKLIAFLQNDVSKKIVQDAAASIFASVDMLDIGIKLVNNMAFENCDGHENASIEVHNLGIDTISSFILKLRLDGQLYDSLQFNGTLYPTGSVSMDFYNISLPEGTETIEFFTSKPNNQIDAFHQNDTLKKTITVAQTTDRKILLILKTDDYPEQTSWELRNTETNEVAQTGGPYVWPNLFMKDTIYINEDGCYKFTVYDSEGDGTEGYCVLRGFNDDEWFPLSQFYEYSYSASCEFNAVGMNIIVDFSSNQNMVCEGSDISFFNLSPGEPNSFEWTFQGGTPAVSYENNPLVNYNVPGNFDVTLTACYNNIRVTMMKENYIQVNALPLVSFASIQDQCIDWPPYKLSEGWPLGGEYSGPGVDSGYFHPNLAGLGTRWLCYTYLDSLGCENIAEQSVYVDACLGINDINFDNQATIYPNPITNQSEVYLFVPEAGLYSVTLLSIKNESISVFREQQFKRGLHPFNLEKYNLSSGIYIFRISTNQYTWFQKVIISQTR